MKTLYGQDRLGLRYITMSQSEIDEDIAAKVGAIRFQPKWFSEYLSKLFGYEVLVAFVSHTEDTYRLGYFRPYLSASVQVEVLAQVP